jgi:phage terminase large subunit
MITLLTPYKRLESKKRYKVVTGGRGSAKSFHISLRLLFLTYNKDEVILFTRYSMVSANDSIIPEFKQKIELLGCEDDFEVTKRDIVNKRTGSRILFRGINTSSGNQTAKLKSIQGLTRWVNDESEEMPFESDFNKIDQSIRVAGKDNEVILVLNPSDTEHWIYKKWFEGGERDDTEYIHTTYLDNLANLSDSFIAIAERMKIEDPAKHAKDYLGKWQGVADAVFEEGYNIYENEVEGEWTIFGGDFGFTDDPTTNIQVTKVGKRIYLKEKLWAKGLDNPAIAKCIKDNGDDSEVHIFDSSEPKSIKELRTENINVYGAKKGPDSVIYGIQKIKQFEVFIHKDSKNLQREWGVYKYMRDPRTGDFVRNKKGQRVPEDKNNHGIDPVRYVLTYFYYE